MITIYQHPYSQHAQRVLALLETWPDVAPSSLPGYGWKAELAEECGRLLPVGLVVL